MVAQLPTLDAVRDGVCTHFGISRADLEGRSRLMKFNDARLAFYYQAREITFCTFIEIGAAVNREHTTVHHGYSKAARLVRGRPGFREEMGTLRAAILDGYLTSRVGHSDVLYGRVFIEGEQPINLFTPYQLRTDSEGRPTAIYLEGQFEPVISCNRPAGVVVRRFVANDYEEQRAAC